MAASVKGFAVSTGISSVTIDLTTAVPVGGGDPITIAPGNVVRVATSVASNDFDITEDSGTYHEICDLFSDDSVNNSFSVWRKVQGDTPDTAVTITNGGVNTISAIAVITEGDDTTTPEDVAPTTATGISSGVPDPPAIEPPSDDTLILLFAGSSESVAITNAPTDYTLIGSQQAGNSNVMAAFRVLAVAALEDPGVFPDPVGTTADAWCACTIAVRSAPPEPEPEEEAAPALTYGAGRLSRERVEAKYRELEEIDRRIAAKEEAERERVRKVEEAKRQLADLAEKKRQTKTIAERRRKLEARIKAQEAEILALRNAIAALAEQIELTQTIADRRRRMVLLLAAAA